MRNEGFDRSVADRRLGLRRAALAAWTVVLVLFAIVVLMPGAPAHRTPDRVIARLVAHSVPPISHSCGCDRPDASTMAASPSLC